jgi:hypothetical protein
MDDLVLAGTIAIIVLNTAIILTAAGVICIFLQFWQLAVQGNTGQVTAIFTGVFIILTAYTGAGLWLQKSGRI